MDVESLIQLDSFGKILNQRIQLAFSFEDTELKQCRCCRQKKNPNTDFVRSTLCKKCHSQKIMEAQRRKRGYGKIREKIIWKNCNLCNQSVKTRQWNTRRQCCLACGKKLRAKETARPKCLQCGKDCSEKKNKFCSFECFNEYRSLGYVDLICGNCGKQFSRKKRIADLYQSHACSIECGRIVAARRSKEELEKRGPLLKSPEEARRIYKEKSRQTRIKANDNFKSLWFRKSCIKFEKQLESKSRWSIKCNTAQMTLRKRSQKGFQKRRKTQRNWQKNIAREIKRIIYLKTRSQRNSWQIKIDNARVALKKRVLCKIQ